MVGQTITPTQNFFWKCKEPEATGISKKNFPKEMDLYIMNNNMPKVRYLRERTRTSSSLKATHGFVRPEEIFKMIPLIVSSLLFESSEIYRKNGYLKNLTYTILRSAK